MHSNLGPSVTALSPFLNTGVWHLLVDRAHVTGKRPAMIWHPFTGAPATWSYEELARAAAATAAGLQWRGVNPGDRVLIHLENCPEFVVSWYGCAAVGAVAVCTNTRSAKDELEYYIKHSGAIAVITQPKFAALICQIASGLKWIAVTDNDGGAPAELPLERSCSFHALQRNPDSLAAFVPRFLDPLCVQYTSGTTSRPKGVLWTHGNGLWAARTNANHQALTPEDCFLCYLPLCHTNALAYNMLASLWVGCCVVLIPKWSTSRFWDIATRYGCTWMSAVSVVIRAIQGLEIPKRHSFRIFGTGICDIEWVKPLGVKSLGWWGMTETVSHGIIGDVYTPNHPGSMGRPAAEYEIAIVNANHRPTEPGEIGDLLIRGVPGLSIFAEYLFDKAATLESFTPDGWFKTGDLVVLQQDGHITFSDRAKDMIRVGGENVAASEIERVIRAVGGVTDVAVVRKPDRKLDEVPVAFVTGTGDHAQLRLSIAESCKNNLADFKIPREVYVVDTLPRGMLGKINKVCLRQAAARGESTFDSGLDWDGTAVP